ncbi:uncharacterized protein FA14DRAFT_15066 [Meira miltonrushii]|uniref:Uncharacterized protein n=1 Tax=Meira miltonrushii TaxID=1280837 RepID=A0A316VJ47_9BASI|nr:uncharacterized protein FA14DRAFT_15066 [Meira miltonrushii]PWN37520.1 hypothetical protein FA14DRAFT_15066 [Meira miltonrushii]
MYILTRTRTFHAKAYIQGYSRACTPWRGVTLKLLLYITIIIDVSPYIYTLV